MTNLKVSLNRLEKQMLEFQDKIVTYNSSYHRSSGKKELVILLCLSSWCLVIVVWLLLTIVRVCLQFLIVVFPDHIHLLFLLKIATK